jgi:serine/threonine protein kinase
VVQYANVIKKAYEKTSNPILSQPEKSDPNIFQVTLPKGVCAHLKIVENIGEGTYSTVFKGIHLPSGKYVAFKQLKRAKYDVAIKEIRTLLQLRCPYIVSYLTWFTKVRNFLCSWINFYQEDYAWIVTELCDRGSLQDFIDNEGSRTGEYVF